MEVAVGTKFHPATHRSRNLLYSCIDFYVAGRVASAAYDTDDQVDVYYVTGKTKDETLGTYFDAYSIGTVGDMNKSNL